MNKQNYLNLDELNDFHFKTRRLFIFTDINSELSLSLIQQMLYLDSISQEPIYFHINSDGGNIIDGFAIIDCIKKLKSKSIAIISGSASSMAADIAFSCSERWMYPHAYIMCHSSSHEWEKLRANDIIARSVCWVTKNREFFSELIKKFNKEAEKRLAEGLDKEIYIFAEEALKLKIASKIL